MSSDAPLINSLFLLIHSAFPPIDFMIEIKKSTAPTLGTLSSTTSSLLNNAAGINATAEFLDPDICTWPIKGIPPSTISKDILFTQKSYN